MNLQIRNLAKMYGERQVLDIDSLDIKQGDLVGIIGPNGAGKSTLIRILAGLEEPTRGKITYNGTELKKEHRLAMTLVFQKPYLLRTNVFKDIAYPLRVRKMNGKAIREHVDAIINEMGLEPFKEKKTWTLSGGESQKVALARALVFQPKLLFLDEPTANIDPSSIMVMEKMIKKINEKAGTTVILISHNIAQVKRLCRHIVFMHRGKVWEAGSKEQIINESIYPETRNFINGELVF